MQTVTMTRDSMTADVHPDEVANWVPFGWVIAGNTAPAASLEPGPAHPDLADLVDDRALEPLADIGVHTVYDFLAAIDDDEEAIIALPYITARSIRKVRKALNDG